GAVVGTLAAHVQGDGVELPVVEYLAHPVYPGEPGRPAKRADDEDAPEPAVKQPARHDPRPEGLGVRLDDVIYGEESSNRHPHPLLRPRAPAQHHQPAETSRRAPSVPSSLLPAPEIPALRLMGKGNRVSLWAQ